MDWLGIDVSKATLDVCWVNEQGKSFEAQFTNDLDGFDKLQGWLAQRATPSPEIHVCMEATGIYSDAIALFCHETGSSPVSSTRHGSKPMRPASFSATKPTKSMRGSSPVFAEPSRRLPGHRRMRIGASCGHW